jgi:HAE1 family hydrophobic/amphiphilic exporter-1
MRINRILTLAAAFGAVCRVFAQVEPTAGPTNAVTRLPAATSATTNLMVTNAIVKTNMFAKANSPQRALGLMEAIQLSLTNNFDVRIQQYEPALARSDIESAKGAYDPVISARGNHVESKTGIGWVKNETVSAGLTGELPGLGTIYDFGIRANEVGTHPFNNGVPFRTGDGNATVIGVTQPLLRNLWINPTRYNIQIARKALKNSLLGFRFRLITTVSAVEQAYFEWIAARENVRVQEEAVALAREEARQMDLKFQIGVAEPLLAQSFESQAASSEAALLTARRLEKQTENTLVNLITTQFDVWRESALEPADQLPTIERTFDAQTSWTQAFEHRPDLHQLIVDLERLGLTEKLRYNQLFPTLDLDGAYGFNASGDSLRGVFNDFGDANRPTWSVGLTAAFPIGNRSARANLKGVRLEKEQANERLKQARQTIMVQVENAIIDARTAWERIPATRQAREYAASALDAYKKRYAAGTIRSLDVLTQQRALTAARTDEIRALVDYNKAVTVLLERQGTLLEERGLNVTVTVEN